MPFEQDDFETPVVFRYWLRNKDVCFGERVIALFPAEEASRGLVTCYEHHGQHGAADYEAILRRTRPATAFEYDKLKRELESPPYTYKLKVVKRRPH